MVRFLMKQTLLLNQRFSFKTNKSSFFSFTIDKIIPVPIALKSSILEGENYYCRLCEAVFSQIQNLNDHIKIYHSSIKRSLAIALKPSILEGKKHHCPHCEAVFMRKFKLDKHVKKFHYHKISQDLSNGVKNEIDSKSYLTKPFRCLYCSESFVGKYDLNLHNKSEHDYVARCPYCNKSYVTKQNLTYHIGKAHTSYHCPYCDNIELGKVRLINHINTFHNSK